MYVTYIMCILHTSKGIISEKYSKSALPVGGPCFAYLPKLIRKNNSRPKNKPLLPVRALKRVTPSINSSTLPQWCSHLRLQSMDFLLQGAPSRSYRLRKHQQLRGRPCLCTTSWSRTKPACILGSGWAVFSGDGIRFIVQVVTLSDTSATQHFLLVRFCLRIWSSTEHYTSKLARWYGWLGVIFVLPIIVGYYPP